MDIIWQQNILNIFFGVSDMLLGGERVFGIGNLKGERGSRGMFFQEVRFKHILPKNNVDLITQSSLLYFVAGRAFIVCNPELHVVVHTQHTWPARSICFYLFFFSRSPNLTILPDRGREWFTTLADLLAFLPLGRTGEHRYNAHQLLVTSALF